MRLLFSHTSAHFSFAFLHSRDPLSARLQRCSTDSTRKRKHDVLEVAPDSPKTPAATSKDPRRTGFTDGAYSPPPASTNHTYSARTRARIRAQARGDELTMLAATVLLGIASMPPAGETSPSPPTESASATRPQRRVRKPSRFDPSQEIKNEYTWPSETTDRARRAHKRKAESVEWAAPEIEPETNTQQFKRVVRRKTRATEPQTAEGNPIKTPQSATGVSKRKAEAMDAAAAEPEKTMGGARKNLHRKAPTKRSTGPKECSHCRTSTATTWRRYEGALLCNACGIYPRTHEGDPRPLDTGSKRAKRESSPEVNGTGNASNGPAPEACTSSPPIACNKPAPVAPTVDAAPQVWPWFRDALATVAPKADY
ncbi:hypothetical protein WJX73_000780 [Symbiochloris irregularis]|uniref:GATA-type domain-containing protein n=1 Tax=Symbiochloris irregularis TaxID=706552 RepID=A0AAW1NQP7_9CHLO